jgi:hypothetical protein
MGVRQFAGWQRERQLAERGQRAGSVSGQLADRVIVFAVQLGPAGVDVLLLFLVSHDHIVAGVATGGEVGRLLYAGQR